MNRNPKYLQELNNKLPIDGKKSYITKDRSSWLVIDENGTVRYKGSRQGWALAFVRKYWDSLQ